VRTGVTLVLTSIFVLIGTGVIFIIGLFAAGAALFSSAANQSASGAAGAATGFVAVLVFFALGMLTAEALQISGYGLSFSVPPRARAKGMAVIAFGLGLGGLVVTILGYVIQYFMLASAFTSGNFGMSLGFSSAGGIISTLGTLAMYSAPIVFSLFLRSCMNSLRERGLGTSLLWLAILGTVFIACLIITTVIQTLLVASMGTNITTSTRPGQSPSGSSDFLGLMSVVCGCSDLLLGLGWVIWYIVSLFQVRGVLSSVIRRA
jgi:hypothetical protein